jgi:hypothetical protein
MIGFDQLFPYPFAFKLLTILGKAGVAGEPWIMYMNPIQELLHSSLAAPNQAS